MIRRSAACKCVRTSSSIFKMSQTCLEESSLVMRHGLLSTTQKSSARAHSGRVRCHEAKESKTVKVKSQSHVDHILRCEKHRPLWVFATRPDNQSASLQKNPAAFASLSAREETRVVAGQIVAASTRQYTCSQCLEHLAVLGREEHRRVGTTSLFTWPCSMWPFSFPMFKEVIRGTRFKDAEAIKRAVTTELKGISEESF